MKQIIKLKEPNSFVEHRTKTHSNFDNIPPEAKEELKQKLLVEQGKICCYCMKRIPEKIEKDGIISYEMKVEHFKCQDQYESLQLTYLNLFGACTGNEGKPKKLQTCDTKKAKQELTINLLTNSPNCETMFKYNAEGEISSVNDDPEINRQINEVLNLNMQTLKDGRSEIYLGVQRKVEVESRQKENNQLKVSYFQQEREKWLIKSSDNKFKPFCMVAVYYLNKKIRQYHN